MLQQAQRIRIQLTGFINKKLQGLAVNVTSLQSSKGDDILLFREKLKENPISPEVPLPFEIREIVREVARSGETDCSAGELMNEIVSFLKSHLFFSVDELSASKAKALYVDLRKNDEIGPNSVM